MDTLTLATEGAALWTGVTTEDCRYVDADGDSRVQVAWVRSGAGWGVTMNIEAHRVLMPNRCIPGTVWTVEP